MIERQLVIPVPAERLWRALTEPVEVDEWFDSSVTWDLRPGGGARFDGHDGVCRLGLVTEVLPGRRLSFRWWEDGGDASEVSYQLDPDADGEATRLVVTERRVEPSPLATGTPEASAAPAGPIEWTAWDTRLVGAWAIMGSVVTVGGRR